MPGGFLDAEPRTSLLRLLREVPLGPSRKPSAVPSGGVRV